MAELPPPSLRLTVDTDALAANWRTLDGLSGEASAGAAVKADAYGLGVSNAVPALATVGCKDFFVAHWAEVQDVTALVPPEQISVLHGPLTRDDADYAVSAGVKPVINSLHQARLWQEAGGGVCDVMVDTGINRLGLSMDELSDPCLKNLQVDVLMSHLASADEDSELNAVQLARFHEAISYFNSNRLSLANSAGIALGSDYAFDQTRPGLALYGGVPRAELDDKIKQVAQIECALMQIRHLKAGDSVGYNATFTASNNMRVGVVSLGYADGLLRSWAGKGFLQHGPAELPILGKVSMDMIVVDLGAAPDVQEGDWLSLPYSLPEAAELSGLSQYELLTILGQRFLH